MVPASVLPSSGARLAGRTIQLLAAAVVMLGASPDRMVTTPAYGVAILVVPPIVGRLCCQRFRPLQRVWFSVGLAVHPIGSLYGLYREVLWYDHLAHVASASLLAGLLYLLATAAVDPARVPDLPFAGHVTVLAVVLVAGVTWEVLELHVRYLVVHGTEDTTADLFYDVVGWLVVAPRWRVLLGGLPDRLAIRVRRRAGAAA